MAVQAFCLVVMIGTGCYSLYNYYQLNGIGFPFIKWKEGGVGAWGR